MMEIIDLDAPDEPIPEPEPKQYRSNSHLARRHRFLELQEAVVARARDVMAYRPKAVEELRAAVEALDEADKPAES